MSKKVYSLNAKQGDPRFLQAAEGNYWFWQRGYEVVGFERQQIDAGDLDSDLLGDSENTIVYGSVLAVRDALARVGRPVPLNIDLPSSLERFVGRSVTETSMGEVRHWEKSQTGELPVHVKPRDRHKLFTGKVIAGYRDLISLSGVPDDEPVIAQEVVDFVSEWRATILRGRVLNVAHYKGDPIAFPDADLMQEAIGALSAAPIGFGMDWAVTSDGRSLLIEVNDGFALGNYGVRGHQYTAPIECRWRQLMGLDDNGVGLA